MFPFGQANVVKAAGDTERVLAVQPDATGRRIAVLSSQALRVWGGAQHTLLLGTATVTPPVPLNAVEFARTAAVLGPVTVSGKYTGGDANTNKGRSGAGSGAGAGAGDGGSARFELAATPTLLWGPSSPEPRGRRTHALPTEGGRTVEEAPDGHARLCVWMGTGGVRVYDVITLNETAAPMVPAPDWVDVEGGAGEDAAVGSGGGRAGDAGASTADGSGGTTAWCRVAVVLAAKWRGARAWGGTHAQEPMSPGGTHVGADGGADTRLTALGTYGGGILLFNSAGMVRVVHGDWSSPTTRGELLVSSLLRVTGTLNSPMALGEGMRSLSASSLTSHEGEAFGFPPDSAPEPRLRLARTHSGAERMVVARVAISQVMRAAALVLVDGRVAVISLSTHVYGMRQLGCLLPTTSGTGLSTPRLVRGGSSSDFSRSPSPRRSARPTRPTRATCAALNAASSCLAVGTADASVHLWRLARHVDGRLVATYTRCISLRQWDFRVRDVGPVQCLQWAPSGEAVAAGYAQRGLAVWARSGCRLWSTLPAAGGCVSAALRPGEPFAHGVRALAWGAGGWSLFVGPEGRGGVSRADTGAGADAGASAGGDDGGVADTPCAAVSRSNSLVVFSLLRTGVYLGTSLRPIAGTLSRWTPLLLGASGAYLLGSRAQSAFELGWAHVRASPVYMAANWPLHTAAVSEDGRQVAVAGRRGLALHSVRTGRWRVFGDVLQELEARCHLVAWLGDQCVPSRCAHVEPRVPCWLPNTATFLATVRWCVVPRLVATIQCESPIEDARRSHSESDERFNELRAMCVLGSLPCHLKWPLMTAHVTHPATGTSSSCVCTRARTSTNRRC